MTKTATVTVLSTAPQQETVSVLVTPAEQAPLVVKVGIRRPVTVRALEARVKRKLAADGERLGKTREGTRAHQDLGRYYIVDLSTNAVSSSFIDDLEPLAKELGLLADWEYVDVDTAA